MSVWTSARSDTARTYLGGLGRVTGLQWETTLPGGDRQASWAMRLRSTQDFPELAQGRKVGVCIGGQDVWTGDLSEPQPNGPLSRSFTADGSSVELARYFAAATGNVWTLAGGTGAVANAQARGMSIKSGTLFNAPYGQSSPNDGSKKMDAVVNEVSDLLGYTWQVNAGTLSQFAYPSSPDYVVVAREQGSRSLGDFVTRMIVRYNNGSAITSVTIDNGQGAVRGDREERLDLSSNGVLTSAQATVLGQAELNRLGVRTKFSSPLTVRYGEVRNLAGAKVDPRTIRAGCVVKVTGLDVSRGGEATGESPQILMGSVVCDYDSKSAVLTPFDFAGKSIVTALAGGFSRV